MTSSAKMACMSRGFEMSALASTVESSAFLLIVSPPVCQAWMMVLRNFGISEDVASIDTKRLAPGSRIDFADTVDVVVERFLEEAPAFVSSVLTSLVLLAFAPRPAPSRSLWGLSKASDPYSR